MTKPYFTLCLRDDNHGFRPEFGDYDRATVEYKMAEYTVHGYLKRNAVIIRTPSDDQATINAAVAALNGHNSDLVETPIQADQNFLNALTDLDSEGPE